MPMVPRLLLLPINKHLSAMANYIGACDNIHMGDFRVRWDALMEMEREEDTNSLNRHFALEFISAFDSDSEHEAETKNKVILFYFFLQTVKWQTFSPI